MKMKTIILTLMVGLFISNHLKAQTDMQTIQQHSQQVENYREMRNEQLINPATTPLTSSQIEKYTGLKYFSVEYKYRIIAQFAPAAAQTKVSMRTTAGGKYELVKYGTATFNYEGKSYALDVFVNNNLPEFQSGSQQLFIPITDLTSGIETSATGRYVPVEAAANGSMVIDFNLAFNPYNAYNSAIYSIIPPDSNNMSMLLDSGERKYEDR